jgi:hypothetical protein
MMRALLALFALLGLAAMMSSGSARNMFATPAVAPLRYGQSVQLMSPQAGMVQPVYAHAAAAQRRSTVPQAMVFPELPVDLPYTLLAEIIDGDGERVYGAVDAPGWVAPVGGIAVIATALLPVLLAPGDDAFRRQQADEQEVKSKFGEGRGVFRNMGKK